MAYKQQARSYSHDLTKLVINPIRLDEQPVPVYGGSLHFSAFSLLLIGSEEGEMHDAGRFPDVGAFPVDGYIYNDLAISEFDATIAKFDFSSAKGVHSLFSRDGHEQLRKAYQFQLLKKNSYIIMMQYNQVPLDAMLQEEYRKSEAQAKVNLTEKIPGKKFLIINIFFLIVL